MVRLARFRRGIASNLYELGANEKIVQRILRHAKPHVTKDRYIKAFDPAVLAATKRMETTLDTLSQSAAIVQRANLGKCGKLKKPNAGEVAEWLKAAVC
jgi:hypothetical protein